MSLRQFAWLLILYYFLYNKQRKTLYLRLKSHQIYISMNSDMMSDNKKVASDTLQRYFFPHALSTTMSNPPQYPGRYSLFLLVIQHPNSLSPFSFHY